ncbi:hypothetical protein [Bacillus sp. ISL-7]|uniref:hypothetical protein n=1 Tax=Bacillus sp. ISL-7 TaxID=2819136 RepID=UPI001BE63F74|nr:hypothetical protein [Bacillus sp. ISL-7]MBT2737833.1 hypothetical protein [Bacillus sp. ISL-7]
MAIHDRGMAKWQPAFQLPELMKTQPICGGVLNGLLNPSSSSTNMRRRSLICA